ncbi:recombinase family protein [Bremerella sp. T1]|uniref:recombinase family protein n=1 Tax=Bremerella sp. TYQ1 TaxID=3119568 RepID=UPI001CCACDDB|nr:recombinase family protein [Bremerella volcania]UBM35194.1 recombinase family protein [Bremerella volcania]
MPKHIAIYVRVSSKTQDTKSQEPELTAWAAHQDQPVKWYRDQASGKSMDRKDWKKLESQIRRGQISQIVIWRLDRLGRTASGLTALFDELCQRKVNLVSIKDGFDLLTPSGRLMANILAGVAQYEREVRGERQAAGIARAKADGKAWGGSDAGVRKKVSPTQEKMIRSMKKQGEPITAIAKAVNLSRPTIYSVLKST